MLKNFIASESGAVTVDWVVLTAALVGLGLAVMGVVSTGVESASTDINGALDGAFQTYDFTATPPADPETPPAE